MGESKFQLNINELKQVVNAKIDELKQQQTDAYNEQIIKDEVRLPALRQSRQIPGESHPEGIHTEHRPIIVKIMQQTEQKPINQCRMSMMEKSDEQDKDQCKMGGNMNTALPRRWDQPDHNGALQDKQA